MRFSPTKPGSHVDATAVAEWFRAAGAARQKTSERIELIDELPRTHFLRRDFEPYTVPQRARAPQGVRQSDGRVSSGGWTVR